MRSCIVAIVGFSLAGTFVLASSQAEDLNESFRDDGTYGDMASLRAELNDLRAELDELKASNLAGHAGMSHGCDSYVPCGWFAGAELAILKPHFGNGVYNMPGLRPWTDFNYNGTPRIHVGLRSADGLGLQASYWSFDQWSEPTVSRDDTVSQYRILGLNVQALDTEVTKAFFLCGIHGSLGAGLRYGKVEAASVYKVRYAGQDPYAFSDVFNRDIEAMGPTIVLDVRHRIGDTRLAIIGNVRSSVLFGGQKWQVTQTTDLPGEGQANRRVERLPGSNEDRLLPVLESQIGLEWRIPVGSDYAYLRCTIEGQWWGNGLLGRPESLFVSGVPEDLGFVGGTVAVGYRW